MGGFRQAHLATPARSGGGEGRRGEGRVGQGGEKGRRGRGRGRGIGPAWERERKLWEAIDTRRGFLVCGGGAGKESSNPHPMQAAQTARAPSQC